MTLFGFDISSWQATLDTAAVAGDFVIIKATGGTSYVNPTCDAQLQAAKAAGKLVAVYHYVHEAGCAGTAEQEADWFVANTRGYQDGSVIFVMDWEGDNVTDSAYALAFKNRFESTAGVRLVVYGSVSQLRYLKPCCDADSPLWVAAYTLGYEVVDGYNPPTGPLGLPDWANVTMWQFTSSGRLPNWGGGLDLNIFYGDRDAWNKLAARLDGAAVAPASTPAPAPVAAPAPAPAPVAPAPAPVAAGGPLWWDVDPGNSMSYIAGQVGVSLASLIAANPGVVPNLIYPGQRLNLPAGAHWPGGGPAPAPAPSGGPTYWIVDPGNTMSDIAAATGVALADLIAVNPGINPNLIYPGQHLNLPRGAHW